MIGKLPEDGCSQPHYLRQRSMSLPPTPAFKQETVLMPTKSRQSDLEFSVLPAPHYSFDRNAKASTERFDKKYRRNSFTDQSVCDTHSYRGQSEVILIHAMATPASVDPIQFSKILQFGGVVQNRSKYFFARIGLSPIPVGYSVRSKAMYAKSFASLASMAL